MTVKNMLQVEMAFAIFRIVDLKKEKVEEAFALLGEVFDELQVGEIRHGLKHGLSVEQVALYSAPEFSWEKMVEIRKGLEHGLSMEQIKTYAKPEFTWRRMRRIRWELEGVAM